MLALLHDRELDAERIHALWQEGYEDFLGLHLVGEEGRKAITLLREGLTDIPAGLDTETLDRLAADFADIYLTHGVRASPCESVWLDEDGLAMQAPMFDVREWYRRYGLAVADWRQRSDDHLVHQLLFLAQLLEPEGERRRGRPPRPALTLARWPDSWTSTPCCGSTASPSGSPSAARPASMRVWPC